MRDSIKRILKIMCIFVGIIFLVHIIFRVLPFPELKEFVNKEYSTAYYDCDGVLLQVTPLKEGLRREYTPLNEIPRSVRKAFIKSEDKRFYFHCGIDFISLTGAFFQNIKAGKTVRGASTITMQIVKMMNPDAPRTKTQKFREIIDALKIEARLSKKQILELYLNSVPFGKNTEGVTSAARIIYGLELNDLNQEQIEILAKIPRRPSSYNPLLTKKSEPFIYPFEFPHYIRYLERQSKADKKNVYKKTLSVSKDLQTYAEGLLRTSLEQTKQNRISNGAVLVIENKTGNVLAWIGNGFWDDEKTGQIDGVLVKNQPGSSMKPFLYALALETTDEKGNPLYLPNTILADVPKEYGSEKLYVPSNFNNKFNGPIRFRVALASSLNVVAVDILNNIGVDNYLKKLYELGFDSLRNGGKEADLGLALGAGEVTLKELVYAFSVFARDGKDYTGNQIYSKNTARIINSILSDKSSRSLGFGYTQTYETDYPSIFKTGTSNQYQNITALGATKDYTVGVWMGNFEGSTVVGKTGSSLPAYIAKNILDYLHKNNDSNLEFEEPYDWSKKKICSLSGMLAGENCPHSVYEYVKKDDKSLFVCDWHKKSSTTNKIDIVYPAEYQKWMRQNQIGGEIDNFSSDLEIISPKNGTLFYFSYANQKRQAITVEAIGGYENEAYIEYDGKIFATSERPFLFFLPVEKGNHSCKVVCGAQEKYIEFEVR